MNPSEAILIFECLAEKAIEKGQGITLGELVSACELQYFNIRFWVERMVQCGMIHQNGVRYLPFRHPRRDIDYIFPLEKTRE